MYKLPQWMVLLVHNSFFKFILLSYSTSMFMKNLKVWKLIETVLTIVSPFFYFFLNFSPFGFIVSC